VFDFISRLFQSEEQGTKEKAKERLQLVLIHDRRELSPEIVDALKEDLLSVVSDYMEVDKEQLEMNLDRQEDQVALVANIPIKKVKREEKTQ